MLLPSVPGTGAGVWPRFVINGSELQRSLLMWATSAAGLACHALSTIISQDSVAKFRVV